MSNVSERIVSRMSNYEQRYGDIVPLRVVARIGELGGVAMIAFEMSQNSDTASGLLGLGITAASCALDLATHRPRVEGDLQEDLAEDETV